MMSFYTRDSEDHHTESCGAGTAPLARASRGTEDLLTKLPIPSLCHWLQTPTEPQGPFSCRHSRPPRDQQPSGCTINPGSD